MNEFKDTLFNQKAKAAIIKQIQEYIIQIEKGSIQDLKLSRTQGKEMENHLLSNMIRDIHNLIVDKICVINYLPNLYFTRDHDCSFEITDLINFLGQELQLIDAIENNNFIKLKEFAGEFENRISKEFIKGNDFQGGMSA